MRKLPLVSLTCKLCLSDYLVKNALAKKSKYCSGRCAGLARVGVPMSRASVEKMVTTKYGGSRTQTKTCSICEKSFTIRTNAVRKNNYCSRDCANKGSIGIRRSPETQFKKGQKSPMGMLGKKHSTGTIAKMSGRKGVLSHRWVKDREKLKVSREKAYDTQYKYWMLDVKNRDGWKCKISNGDCSGRLEAHHILGWKDYPELRYQTNNGITLCLAHHPRKRAEEKRLSPYFQSLVAVSKE